MQKFFSSFILLVLNFPLLSVAETSICTDYKSAQFKSISQIQSSADSSPYVGQRVITEGVVTRVAQLHYSGFWLQQAETAKHNPHSKDLVKPVDKRNASQGIFIYHAQQKVQVGDKVRLLGTVTEYHGLTEITAVEKLIVCEHGQNLPGIKLLSLPVDSLSELEALEGMRIQLKQDLVVSDLFGAGYGLGNYGQFAVSSKLHFHPSELLNLNAYLIDPSLIKYKDLDYLLIDDGKAKAFPTKIPFPNPQGFSSTNPLRVGDQVKEVTGVLHAYDEHYILIPDFHQLFIMLPSSRSEKPNLDPNSNVRIASFNLGNYFNGDARNGELSLKGFPSARGAKSYQGFLLQRQKIVAALIKMDADIIALMELENDGYGSDSAIADLTRALNQAYKKENPYGYIDAKLPQLGRDAISVGFLYRKDTISINSPAKVLHFDLEQKPTLMKSVLIQNNRPSLAQVFTVQDKDLLVVANHFKSKGRPCLSDSFSTEEVKFLQGHCNQERVVASEQLIKFLSENYSPALPSLLLGDFNAYSQEQPLLIFYRAGYKNLKAADQFSYSFQGYLGNLDHALSNASLIPYVLNSYSWNINSPEDVLLDYQTEENGHPYPAVDHYGEPDEFRSSDHDPILIELKF